MPGSDPTIRGVRTIRNSDLDATRIEAELTYYCAGDVHDSELTATYDVHGTTAVLRSVRLDDQAFDPITDGAAALKADMAVRQLPHIDAVDGFRDQLARESSDDREEVAAADEDVEQAIAEVSD